MTDSLDPRRRPTPLSAPFEAQREAGVQALTRAFEQGAITLEEFDERLDLATTATTTADLQVLTEDLPAAHGSLAAPTHGQIRVIFGNEKRQGPWVLSSHLRVRCVFGSAWLDLSDVSWPSGPAEIDCRILFGNVLLLVPPGVRVNVSASSLLGDVKNAMDAFSGTHTRDLHVKGHATFGSLTLKTAYPKGIGRK